MWLMLHRFLLWAPVALAVGAFTLAQFAAETWPEAKDWIAESVKWAWTQMVSDLNVALLVTGFVLAYIAVIIWSGLPKTELATNAPRPQKRQSSGHRVIGKQDVDLHRARASFLATGIRHFVEKGGVFNLDIDGEVAAEVADLHKLGINIPFHLVDKAINSRSDAIKVARALEIVSENIEMTNVGDVNSKLELFLKAQ